MNEQVRRRQFWIAVHRYLGLATLLFLGLAAATGVVLSFDKSLDALLNPNLFRTNASQPIAPQKAIAALERLHPEVQVLSFPLAVPIGRTLLVTVGTRPGGQPLGYDQIFIDRNDGHIAGTRQSGAGWDRRHLVAGVYQLHYTLLAGTAGRWLMGLVAFGWLIGNFVGLYLTLPMKGAFWRLWKKAWTFRWGNPLPRLMHDLHRASGLWALIGITVMAFTSLSLNFYDELFTPAMQALSPYKPTPFDGPSQNGIASPRVSPLTAAGIAAREGLRRGLQWRPAKVTYDPDFGVYRVLFTDSGIENYHEFGPQSVYVSGTTGGISHFDDPYTDSLGRKVSRALYPLHTGQVAGWGGVAVVVVLGLTTVEMCVSGAYLWWKRRRGRIAGERARRARAKAAG